MGRLKGMLILVSGPSGVGKNTLVNSILKSNAGLSQMPTATTRQRRPDELDGREHYFISDETFDRYITDDAFLEWQTIHGNQYGTLRKTVVTLLNEGRTCIADVDVKGAFNLKQAYRDRVVLVFVLPPSPDALAQRILQRGVISDHELAMRIGRAAEEFAYSERCDYQIVNDVLEAATKELERIIQLEKNRRLSNRFRMPVARLR